MGARLAAQSDHPGSESESESARRPQRPGPGPQKAARPAAFSKPFAAERSAMAGVARERLERNPVELKPLEGTKGKFDWNSSVNG